MGNPVSKLVKIQKNDMMLEEISTPPAETAPTVTISETMPIDLNIIDPRSPSVEIARTPIETNLMEQLPATPKNHLQPEIQQEFDPRSPTIEISRTPIIIKNPVVQIKNTDDIRRKLLKGNTIKKLTKSTEDMLSEQRKQGILETDLDYIETDIDLVYHHKTTKYLKNSNPLNVETGFVLTLEDPRSPSCGINRTPIQVPKELNEDPRSPTVEFIRTPILKLPPVEEKSDNCESFNELLDSLTLEDEKIEEIIVTEPLLTTVEVKPTQSLIYEDKEVSQVVTPSRKVSKDGRTPLGARNGRSKSANGRLLQNTNKNEFEVGKIPIFNNMNKNEFEVGKIPIYNKNLKKLKAGKRMDSREQCENTPPKNVMKRRTGSAHQWDATDNTLII